MNTILMIIVTFFAGMGAGLGTGFAGMSAAAVISPMLITFLGMDPYMAVGIALSSDVLASAVSAYTYGKNKNLDVKNGLIMMVSVLTFTVVGSYVSSLVPSTTMGNFSVFMTFLLGIKFIVKPVMTTKEAMEKVSPKKRAVQSLICGAMIGFIWGFIGADLDLFHKYSAFLLISYVRKRGRPYGRPHTYAVLSGISPSTQPAWRENHLRCRCR